HALDLGESLVVRAVHARPGQRPDELLDDIRGAGEQVGAVDDGEGVRGALCRFGTERNLRDRLRGQGEAEPAEVDRLANPDLGWRERTRDQKGASRCGRGRTGKGDGYGRREGARRRGRFFAYKGRSADEIARVDGRRFPGQRDGKTRGERSGGGCPAPSGQRGGGSWGNVAGRRSGRFAG